MKHMFKAIALASVAIAGVSLSVAPAAAQTRLGVGVMSVEGAMGQSTVYTNAQNSIRTTYASQIQQLETQAKAAETELKPLIDAYNNAVRSNNQAQIQTTGQALQTKRTQINQRLAPLQQPIALASAYVEEQIARRLDEAVRNTMKAKKVDLIVQPNAVIAFEPYVNLTNDLAAEITRLVPTVSVTPPAGWQPGQQQAAPAAAPAAPAAKPKSR